MSKIRPSSKATATSKSASKAAPKASVATKVGAMTDKDTQLLLAMISLMEGPPEGLDYNKFASRIGIKHVRNAKTSLKKTMDKVRISAGDDTDIDDEDKEELAEEETPKKFAAKKTVPKKKVGNTTEPKKANVGRPRGKKVTAVKELSPDADDNDAGEDEQEAADAVDEHVEDGYEDSSDVERESDTGKSFFCATPLSPVAMKTGSPIQGSVENYIEESLSVTGAGDQQSATTISALDTEDERHAAAREISVAEWRRWKANNNYDHPVCPHSPVEMSEA